MTEPVYLRQVEVDAIGLQLLSFAFFSRIIIKEREVKYENYKNNYCYVIGFVKYIANGNS